MKKKSKSKFMGLYSLEQKECGCQIKRYSGGKVITIGCVNHQTFLEYSCPICEKKCDTMDMLKKCKWSHAF